MNSARQRKVSAVNEESQAEGKTVQEQRPRAVTSKSHIKSRDSDEEIQRSNSEAYPGITYNSNYSALYVTGDQILSAPTDQNLGLADSGGAADGETHA
jgi:hypothetical protein